MDQQRFDAALRALNAGTTRRKGLAGMLGVLLGGAAADASARGERRRTSRLGTERPCGDGSAADNRCTKNGNCCTRYCVNGGCRCKPNYMTCGKAAHCCSGRCVGGRCDGGAKPEGGACVENFNCKNGLACIKGICTASSTAKCTLSNCPGCCNGTTCRPGTSERACGAGGGACAACDAGKTCNAGICTGGGCTGNNQCTGASDTCISGTCTCGGNAACSGSTPICVSGTCVECGANSDCTGNNDTCTAGTCTCGGGASCAGATPLCTAGVCAAGTWGNATTFGTGPGSTASQFTNPLWIAVAPDGLTAWIADNTDNRVSVWTRPSATSTAWANQTTFGTSGSGTGNLNGPRGVVATADGLTLLIVDSVNYRVSVWTRPSATSTVWTNQTNFGSGGGAANQFSNPNGLTLTADGLTALIGDTGNNRISVWTRPSADSTAWTNQTTIGTGSGSGTNQFFGPSDVAVSQDGLTIWVSDWGNDRISVWTRPDAASTAWSNQTTFGSQGSGANQFSVPIAVSATPDGLTAVISDMLNYRISVWTRPDAASTAWTNLTTFGSQGSGAAQFGSLNGVAVTPDGLTAFVTDAANYRISVWTYA